MSSGFLITNAKFEKNYIVWKHRQKISGAVNLSLQVLLLCAHEEIGSAPLSNVQLSEWIKLTLLIASMR
jgi:hypothetical protein